VVDGLGKSQRKVTSMQKSDYQSLTIEDGHNVLEWLFKMATNRLRDRGISFSYSIQLIDWILSHPGWKESRNPIYSLDHLWHQIIADSIKKLMIDRQLQPGDSLNCDLRGNFKTSEMIFYINGFKAE
jgi:hypothetical protein